MVLVGNKKKKANKQQEKILLTIAMACKFFHILQLKFPFFSFRQIGDFFYPGFKSMFLMQIGQFKVYYF